MTEDRESFRAARAAGLAKRHERRLAHALERETDGFVIPVEAVEAAAHSLYKSDAQGQWVHGELDLLLAYREAARAALAAALPHLRAQGCVKSDQICGDLAAEVEPWLQQCGSCDAALPMGCTCPKGDYRNILLKVWRAYEASHTETKALAETAIKLGVKLGRQEAAGEIAAKCLRRAKLAEREGMVVTWLAAERLAREIGGIS